jgi:aryl-alcohol dehydrogenase-like predicted oxidoreductase
MSEAPRIGFGTAAIGRSLAKRERTRVLETAFACGLTYFDTAPVYGTGAAEEALAALPRDRITIATKAGIRPPSLTRLAVGRIVRRPPSGRGGVFAPADLRASLEASLRRLRTPYVDVFLLHEVRAEHLDDALLAELDAIVQRGEARVTGIATAWGDAARILEPGRAFPAVVQVAAAADPPALDGRRLVLHSAIAGRTGAPGDLLRAAAEGRPDALVLFGSRDPEHVRETATAVTSLL